MLTLDMYIRIRLLVSNNRSPPIPFLLAWNIHFPLIIPTSPFGILHSPISLVILHVRCIGALVSCLAHFVTVMLFHWVFHYFWSPLSVLLPGYLTSLSIVISVPACWIHVISVRLVDHYLLDSTGLSLWCSVSCWGVWFWWWGSAAADGTGICTHDDEFAWAERFCFCGMRRFCWKKQIKVEQLIWCNKPAYWKER